MTKTTFFTLSVTLALKVATPTFTPSGGSFADLVSVAIQTTTPGASIYYTTDASMPTQSSTRYIGPLALTASTTLYAQAFLSGYTPSAAVAATFNNLPTPRTTSGKIYYVATNGSDSNSCSAAQSTSTPKRNITGTNGGLSCLTAGNADILDIRSGTYNDRILSVVSGTSYANAATIRAYSGETVTLTGGIALEGPSFVIFEGLTIRNSNVWVGSTFSDGSKAGHHIRFINIDASVGAPYVIIEINRFAHHVEFIGGNFHGAGLDLYAFYISGKDNLIENAKIYDNTSFGVHIYSGGYPERADRNIVRFNEFYMNGTSQRQQSAAILLSSGDSNQAYGNIVRDNVMSGISSSNGATNSKIYNNTVVNNNTSGVGYGGILWGTGSATIITNNIVYNNRNADFADANGVQTPTFSNNHCTNAGPRCARSGNPLFVDLGNKNYRLDEGSSAKDNGTILIDIPPYDMLNTHRPKGNGWDIGAIESW